MSNTHSFHNLTDFFGEPQDFRDFTMIRKPSAIGDEFLLGFDERSMSLELDFINTFEGLADCLAQPAIPELQLSGFELPQVNEQNAESAKYIAVEDESISEATSTNQQHCTKQTTRSNDNQRRQKKKFENKNSARNIVRKTIRCIESGRYEEVLREMCTPYGQDYKEFCNIMSSSFEEMTGPQALRKFLEPEDTVSRVFREFLLWFLKERYIREALREGHMENIKQYVEFKNRELLPLLMRL